MHTGLEDQPWDVPKLAAYFAERARGGVGLIDHRRLRRQQARLAQAVRRRDDHPAPRDAAPRRSPTRCTRTAARSRCRCCTPAATPTTRSASAPPPRSRRSRRSRPKALSTQGRAPHGRRLRAVGRARAQGGLRRGRGDGVGGLPDQPVPRGAHQRPHRRVGRRRLGPDALPGRIVRADPRGRRRRLPGRSTGSRCSTWSRAARPGTRPSSWRSGCEAAGRHRVQHRHRLARGAGADDHHPGPARDLGAVDGPAAGVGRRPGDRLQPDQHPRAGRAAGRRRHRRPGVDGAPVPRRPRLRRQGRGRPRRRDQHLHRLQPGLPRPHLPQPDAPPAWSTRGPATRRRWCSARPAAAATVAVVGAGPAGLADRRLRGRARLRRSRCSRRRRRSAASSGWRWRCPGKEDFADTLRYYARRLEVLGVEVRLSTRATATDLASYDEVVVATGVEPRMPGRSRASTTRAWCRTPTCSPAGSCPASGSP